MDVLQVCAGLLAAAGLVHVAAVGPGWWLDRRDALARLWTVDDEPPTSTGLTDVVAP